MTRDFYRRWRTINVSTKQCKLVESLIIFGRFFYSPKFGGKTVARVNHSSHTLFAMFLSKIHSRLLRPSSFCSAPRIATSGMVQFSGKARRIRFVFSANQTVRLGSERAQSDGKSVNLELQVLNRGRNSWCWPGTRMSKIDWRSLYFCRPIRFFIVLHYLQTRQF